MLERELKLHVPPAGRDALENELRLAGATTITLRARYFDTPDQGLAQAGIALRLRLEGSQWVQTIKAPGPDELTRLELNHPRNDPELDLSVYQGTTLEPFFADLGEPLRLRYETHIERLVLRRQSPEGVVEFAYDQGVIRSGPQEMAVCELELEQIDGSVQHLFALGRQWLERYQLILDFRSKAERGSRLADPTRTENQKPLVLSADTSLRQAYQQYASDCLNQIVRNAMHLATADTLNTDQALCNGHARKMEAGIRRLRSCWKLLSKLSNLDYSALDAELQQCTRLDGRGTRQAAVMASSVRFQSCLLGILQHLVEQAEQA